MEPRIVSCRREPFASALGTPIAPHAALDEVAATDIAIVTDLAVPADADPRERWTREGAWLRRRLADGTTVCSVCTGSVLLAGAGLLDGWEATTHWSASSLFRRHFPTVRLRPEAILLPSGPEHRLVTSGGSASWEELALYLIARFCGHQEAVRIAKLFILGDRSDGQLPFSAMRRPHRHEDAIIARCQEWLADNYAGPTPVARMAALSRLPERSFKRRFRAATGYTPIEYVHALRIEEAKQLLETTSQPVEAIAAMVGYEDPAFWRRLFKRQTGVTPAHYRRRLQRLVRQPA